MLASARLLSKKSPEAMQEAARLVKTQLPPAEKAALTIAFLLPRRMSREPVPPNSPFETADTVRYFHQGDFPNAEREAEVIQFWKTWWRTHRAAIAPSAEPIARRTAFP